MIDSIPLFPTMIYKFNIDPKLYDKQNIINVVEKNYQKSNYRNNFDSNSDLHHSYGDFDNDNYITGRKDFVVGPAILIKKDALKIWAS